jgi:hypothetical protein
MYPSSGGAFGRSFKRRYGEFTKFLDENNVMPLLLLRSSSLWFSGAVPEFEPTILDYGHVLMEVMAQCCILYNVLYMSGRPLCYRWLCCYWECPLETGKQRSGNPTRRGVCASRRLGSTSYPRVSLCCMWGACVPRVPTIANLSAICAKD